MDYEIRKREDKPRVRPVIGYLGNLWEVRKNNSEEVQTVVARNAHRAAALSQGRAQ